jgi:DNA-3-methyladenine glycosylase
VHWCFNAVTDYRGSGTAVLVRAVEPLDGVELMRRRRWGRGAEAGSSDRNRRGQPGREWDLTNGPGKLCAALGIDGDLSGLGLRRPPLVVRRGSELADSEVAISPRIGLTKAAAARHRYFVRDNPFVSRTPGHFTTRPYRAVAGRA